ncbi:transposase [Streptomyces sp. NPDC001034]|uniref:transposase n=1 Tax=Streptomyces sp. NPDC001034 TaxID=3154375 RepID=UPI00331DED0D
MPDHAPRALDVDESAFRKGCTYSTVPVDVEAGRVVDVLPDRTSETFAAWLTEHRGTETIWRIVAPGRDWCNATASAMNCGG